MPLLASKHSWLVAPILWGATIILLITIWACATPQWVQQNFNQRGTSPVEIVTIGFFWLQMAFFWLMPPICAGKQRPLWLGTFSLITFFAISRELDWHRLLIKTSQLPGATSGTPFKMRFLTNTHNPLSDRLLVLFIFIVVIGVCLGTLLYFLPRLLKGFLQLHPVSWSIGFMGGTVILINLADRIPSILRKKVGIEVTEKIKALFTILEEGQELLLPLFVILAVIQAFIIYNHESDTPAVQKWRAL